jgi:serine/threonine-protein kinase
MPLADATTFAGYTIVRRLGSGGMGEVYLARHPRLPRQDALKVLRSEVSADGEYRERFNRQADIAATLWHPHIVGVHDRGEFNMPAAEVAEIITAVADALDYAHQRNLLHRDVKPANVLVARGDQRILLADFGIARWADDTSGLTATNMTVGTVSYAAPEQLMGGNLDGRADQYALAATAFHLLTGSPPFQHTNPAVVISQHLNAPPPAIGDHRPDLAVLDPVLAKALAKNPDDRFERCADFARALEHRIGGDQPDATRLSPVAGAAPEGRRSPIRPGVVIPAVLAILLVAAIGFALLELTRADDERAAPPATSTSATSRVTPLPPPPEPPPPPSATTTTAATTSAAPTTDTAAPVAVIGADCSPLGGTGMTANGATAYCSTLQNTGASIWSLSQGDVASPTVTTAPADEPLPIEEESPVRVCMQQTGQTRRQCREDIRRSNGLP